MKTKKIKTQEKGIELATVLAFPKRKRRPRKASPPAGNAQILELAEYRKRASKPKVENGFMSYFPGYGVFYTYWMWVPVWKIS